MVDTEDYFPRGGKKPTTKFFKQSTNFLGAPEKAEKKKKKRTKKKSEDDDGYLSDEAVKQTDQSYKNCSVWLKYTVVREGLLMLGRVRQVQDTRVYVSLPCRMSGLVMACHISEAYNKLLEAYVNDQIDQMKELQQMFRPGQYVALKVLEVANDHLMLSMMPQHVNSGKMQADLHKGALLQAAVTSVEDHGYLMDIGIPNIRAFLPKNAANPEIDLDTGMVTWCSIKSITASPESSVVTLTSELGALQRAFQKKPSTPILPANAVDFTVDKPLDNGIEGQIFDNQVAYIQRQHVDKVNGKKPALGQKIRARLLYVLPTTNTPFLTMRNIFETTYPNLEEEQKFQEGDIIEAAQVIKIIGRTVYLRLGEDSEGLLSLRRIQVDEDLEDKDVVAKSYPLGSTHKVRVLRYNMLDFSYAVTDERHIVEERYFSLAQLSVGDTVDATVAKVADSHVILQVGRVTGFVPQAHLTDAGIFIDPKKASNSKLPKKKFKVGQEVNARVLGVDPAKKSLILTLKPSLLVHDLDVLKSYQDAQVGKSYTGVIAHIKDYLVVSFFNSVQAYVPRRFVSTAPLDNLTDAFHVGQIVNCTILRVDPEAKKMSASLTTAPFTPKENYKKSENRKRPKDALDSADQEQKLDGETDDAHETPKKKKKRKNNDSNQEQEQPELGAKESKKKKKKELINVSVDEVTPDSTFLEQEELDSKPKKKKKKELEETPVIGTGTDAENVENNKERKKKKKKDRKAEETLEEEQEIKEESDHIETDFNEDSDHILTPQDLGLIDMSDCTTAKQYKKRVVSLLKAVNARIKRTETIDKKILNIEDAGLNPKNKKYHTAMHMEKLVIEERIKKLLEALKVAQEKLKEFGIEQNTDYKEKKKAKKVSAAAEAMETDEVDNSESNERVVKKLSKDEEKALKNKLKEIIVVEELKPALEVPSAKDFWSANTENLAKTAQEESSSSEDEEEEKPKKKRKKLTAVEKVAKVREEEERIRELERRAVESESQPRSSEQFERALLATPNCSQLWIAYMAFHLQATEIEKARAVARKALNTICFREEDERLNVWIALLNMENRFGTKECQQSTLEEALQKNDPYKVHCSLLDVYLDTGKPQELAALCELMCRRYRGREPLYARCGEACFRAHLLDKARQLMQRGLAALEKKQHVNLLTQFALLERRHGERERAEALFEQVLAVYPQRVDVACVYVDMLAKTADVQHVRQVMERMTSHKLPARKMKVLYKKWIEIEEKIGDQEHVESIRQRATEFIDKAKF